MIRIDFKQLKDSGACNIFFGENDGSTPTVVRGTRNVFTTNEEDDPDVFMPVRCTNGTVNFYNENDVWTTLADITEEHRLVRLVKNGTDLWRGYINKGYVGTKKMFGYHEECDICVQCPLSELDTVYYTPTMTSATDLVSLSDVVADILDNPFGDNVLTSPGIPNDTEVQTIAALRVYVGAFYNSYKEDNGTIGYEAKYTRKEALEKVLEILCCSARWNGTAVEIIASKPTSTASTTLTLNNPADTESQETAVMPYKKVRVSASADGYETAVEIPTQAVQNWAQLNKGHAQVQGFGPPLYVEYVAWMWGSIGRTFSSPDEWKEIEDEEYNYWTDRDYNDVMIVAYADLSEVDISTSTGYDLVPAVFLNYSEDLSTVTNSVFKISTKTPFFIQDAILSIQMRLMKELTDRDFSGTVQIAVSIGNKFYDQSANAWTESATPIYFEAPFENGELIRSRNMNMNFDTYSGYGIPVNEVLSGTLEVWVKSSHDLEETMLTIESMSVKAVRHIMDIKEKDTYTATGTKGRGESSVEIVFCSERRADNADNFLFSHYMDQVIRTVDINGVMIRPEQWIANRRKEMTTGKARSLLIVRQMGDIASGVYSYNGKVYQTISFNHDWAENITEAHLLEIS